MNGQKFLPLFFLALFSQACDIDIYEQGRDRPLPPSRRSVSEPQLRAMGESCTASFQCAPTLQCLEFVCEPERIGIYPHGALVAPGTAEGLEWDADRYLPNWVWEELDYARAEGVASQFDLMDYLWEYGFSAPDPFGYGFLAVDGRYEDHLSVALLERGEARDRFEAHFPFTGWSEVPLGSNLLVAFDLFDADRRSDEFIGGIELDLRHLREALYLGGTVWFDTYDATAGQLLLFGLEVVAE